MKSEGKPLAILSFLSVFVICLFASLIIFTINQLTGERIETNKKMAKIRIIEAVMPLNYDNVLYEDTLDVAELSTSVYRARHGKEFIGLVFMPIAATGYNGKINLALGVNYDGMLTGVRVVEQHETSGLGDAIDQNNSDWLLGFDKRSLSNTQTNAWAVRSEDGDFDNISGATISPRGVINAVKRTLDYYAINKAMLYQ
jgi:Na+-translocating ferredoxin:NAD+ oxidoreductase subunit G